MYNKINKKCADFFTPLIGNQNILQRLFFRKVAAFKRISPHLISLLCRIFPRRPRLNKEAFLLLEGIFQTVLADIMGFAPMRVSQSRLHCVIL